MLSNVKIEVFDLYGIKKDFSIRNDIIELKNSPKGNIRIVRATTNEKVISKMIVTD